VVDVDLEAFWNSGKAINIAFPISYFDSLGLPRLAATWRNTGRVSARKSSLAATSRNPCGGTFSSPFPERAFSCAADRASPPRLPLEASPLPAVVGSGCPDIWCLSRSRLTLVLLSSPFGPSRRKGFRGSGVALLGFANATTSSADLSLRPALAVHVPLSSVRRDLPR
jgi:hypothetical protein